MVSDKIPIMSLYIESKSDKRIRQTASITVLILAVSSGVLSYNALRELAIMAGIHPILAFLFPITLDGLILAGSLLILYFAVRGKRSGYGLFLTALGVIASIAGNVVISPDNLTYQILHATSPVVLFLSLESLMILLRARSRSAMEAENLLKQEQEQNAKPEPLNTPTQKPQEAVLSPSNASRQDLTDDVPVEAVKTSQPLPVVVASKPVEAEKPPVALPNETVIKKEEPVAPTIRETVATLPVKTVEPPVKKASETPVKKAAEKPPVAPVAADGDNPPSKRELIRDLLIKDPEMDAGVIVDMIGGDRKYVRKLVREERDKLTV